MDIYSEIILDHFKNPKNKGKLKNPHASADEVNPTCGDEIHIELILDKNDKIKKVAFTGQGCAISQASASMLTSKITGMTPEEVLNMPNDYIFNMLKIKISPSRAKCALLSLIALKSAIKKLRKPS